MADMIQSDFRRYFQPRRVGNRADCRHLATEECLGSGHRAFAHSSRRVTLPLTTRPLTRPSARSSETGRETSFQDVELDSAGDISGVIENARTLAKRGGGQSDLFQLSFARIHGRHYLVVSIAHALYDGWSLGLMHQDVIAAYSGEYSPRPSFENHLGYILQSSGQEEARRSGAASSRAQPLPTCVRDTPLEVPRRNLSSARMLRLRIRW